MYVYFEGRRCLMWEMVWSWNDFIKSIFTFDFQTENKTVSDFKFDHVSNQWKAKIQEMNLDVNRNFQLVVERD